MLSWCSLACFLKDFQALLALDGDLGVTSSLVRREVGWETAGEAVAAP